MASLSLNTISLNSFSCLRSFLRSLQYPLERLLVKKPIMQGPLTFFTKGWKCLLIVQGGSITKGAKDTFLYFPIFWIFLKDPFMKLFVFSFFSDLNNKRIRNVFCWARLLFLIVIIGTITIIITFNIIIIVIIFILVNVIIIINIIKLKLK